jgi:hypothetical protein
MGAIVSPITPRDKRAVARSPRAGQAFLARVISPGSPRCAVDVGACHTSTCSVILSSVQRCLPAPLAMTRRMQGHARRLVPRLLAHRQSGFSALHIPEFRDTFARFRDSGTTSRHSLFLCLTLERTTAGYFWFTNATVRQQHSDRQVDVRRNLACTISTERNT